MKDLEELEAAFKAFNLTNAGGSMFLAVKKRVEAFIGTDVLDEEEETTFVTGLFQCYAAELLALCTVNAITRTVQLSEAEAVIGTVVQKSSQPRKRKQAISKLREGTDTLVRGIRDDLAGDDSVSAERGLRRAWVAWKFAIAQGNSRTFGVKSFAWIALGAIFEAIEEITRRTNVSDVPRS
jgi:hypothetical protein